MRTVREYLSIIRRYWPAGRSSWSAPIGLTCLAAACLCSLLQSDNVRAQNARANATAYGAEYLLGPQDKVRVKVFAWRPSRDEVYEWKALNDVYTVGASGQLSLPLIGEVPAAGSALNDLSNAIGEQLKATLGLVDAPRASVEIVEFRPFYILGAVQRPGEYPYRPGLTIIQAVSIGGGLLRLNEYEAARLGRETIATNGERSVFESEINALVAKRARLEAEVNGETEVKFPASLLNQAASPGGELLLQEEERIFHTRRGTFERRIRELERNKGMLQSQLKAIEEHLSEQVSYVRVAKDEVKLIDDLFERKLTTNARRADAARSLHQVEGERIRLQTTMTSVRQDYSRIDMEVEALRDARLTQAVSDLRAIQAKMVSPHLVSSKQRKASPDYTIIRQMGTESVRLSGTESTLIQPSDTIEVTLPTSEEPLQGPTQATGGPREVLPERHTRLIVEMRQ
jgi:polysaccharide biosynthesis/export protein